MRTKVFGLVFLCALGLAPAANADCGVEIPQPPPPVESDLLEISEAAKLACSALPVEIFSSVSLYELEARRGEAEAFLEFDLDNFKSSLERTCQRLEEEDGRINLAVRKNRDRAPNEQQAARKISILQALAYCAYSGANYQEFRGVKFQRNVVFWNFYSRLEKKALEQMNRYDARRSECIAQNGCTAN